MSLQKNKVDRGEVSKQVREIITKQFSISAERITENTLLDDDLGADSMALVELMVNLEERFQMEMPALTGPEIEHVRTVGDVINFIYERFSLSTE